MGSKIKRFLALLLAVLMLVSTVPVSAQATESEHDHEHESTATTEPVSPASNSDAGDPEESETPEAPETSEDSGEPEQEVTDSPAATPEFDPEQVCYQPGDANSDGEVHVNDAFYVLYHSLLPDDYPMNHDGDYDADGDIDKDDALLVLKYMHGMAAKPAYTHVYQAPVWNWSEDGESVYVSVTFSCACGNSHTFDSYNNFGYEMVAQQGATCTEDGFERYTASVEFEGVTYTNEYVRITELKYGHTVNEESVSCEEGAACDRCDYTLEAKGHSWGESVLEAGDCQTYATLNRTCENCGATESEVQTEITYPHAWEYTGDVAVEEIPCGYVKAYVCTVCGATKDVEYDEETGEPTNVFYKHTYTAALTTEATCTTAGQKTLTCACGDVQYESVPANPEAHTWVLSDTEEDENGVVTNTYTCACGESKTAVDASKAAVPQEVLAENNGELTVGDVSISMDTDTVNALTGDVTVDVATADKDSINLSEEQKNQIGNNPVYNFTMTSGEETVTEFGGKVTISLPYTLQPGDDVDCIDVWFIADDGTVTVQKGTYSNGFVTFETEHFSYYTVTQLTAEERCQNYGHIWQTISKDPTCVSNGYSMEVCQRCEAEQNSVNIPMLEHAYSVETTAATCTSNGMEVKTCPHCGTTSRTTLFALGHNMTVTESVAATCTEEGYEVKTCANGECGVTQTVRFSALGHSHQYTETVAPSCTAKGYEVYACSCGDVQYRNEQPAHGHSYVEAENAWSWNDELTAATVTLVCSHDESHTTTQKAVVSEVINAASCTAGGSATYNAKVTYNNVSYENVRYSEQAATGHATASEEWQTTAAKHYRTCDTCGVRIDQADHNWGGAEITVSPNCVSTGKATYACTVCGYSRQETVPATGIHTDTDADGSCDICGFREETCTRELTVEKLMDLSGYNVCEGTRILEVSCECGKEKDYRGDIFVCDWAESTTYDRELANGNLMTVNVTACQDCGIVIESGVTWLPVDGSCDIDNTFYEKLTIDGEIIFERETHDYVVMGHDPNIPVEEKTVTADGFCGAEILVSSCACGDYVIDFSSYNCQWVLTESDDSNNPKWVCSVCGATRCAVYIIEPDGCYLTNATEMTLEYNGQVLHSVRTHYRMIIHNYKLENYVLDGETCEDGVTLTYKCAGCGEINEYHTDYHELNTVSVTDVSSWGNPCMVEIEQSSCPCGSWKEYYTNSDTSCTYYYHDWTVIREEGDTTVSACQNCGYTLTSVRTMSEKEDDCRVTNLCTDTISDGGEHSVTLYRVESYEEHNLAENRTLLGESCEDGVRFEAICQDCGYLEYTDTYHDHGGIIIDSFNLSEFGGCDTQCEVYRCACGRDSWWGTYNENCNWEYLGWENDTNTWTCTNCGISRKETSKYLGTDGCVESYLNTITFLKNGRTVKTFSFTNNPVNHDYIYELTLHEGAASCEDGYVIKGICQKCGYTYESDYYGCSTWVTDRVVSPEGALCGDLVVDYRACACGANGYTENYWMNGECWFEDTWDEETGEWHFRCVNCGTERVNSFIGTTPGKLPCSVISISNIAFFRDGACVFSYEDRNAYYEHDWISSYQLEEGAENCDGGYTVYSTCAVCGFSTEEYTFGCSARVVAKNLAVSREDICGDIYRVDWSCACGANSYAEYDTSCNFEITGIDEETGAEQHRCQNCDLRYDYLIETEPVPDTTCKIATVRTASYYVGEELLFSESSTSVNDDHNTVTGFRLLGETCSDGYYTNDHCSKCGQIFWENEEICYDDCFNHTYTVEQETIFNADCGTTFSVIQSCACGANRYPELWSACDFYESESDEDGNQIRRCANCGIEERTSRSMELVEGTTCDYVVTWTSRFYNGEEFLGTYVSTSSESNHDWAYGFRLLGEDCDDGYYVYNECTLCGQRGWESEEAEYGCSTYGYWDDTPYFEDAGACGAYYWVTGACACGKNQYTRLECRGDCWLEWIEEVDGEVIYRCSTCGLTMKSRSLSFTVDKENCIHADEVLQTYSMDGVQLGEFQVSSQWSSHTWLYSYELLGETCDSGYNKVGTCYYCGKQETNETEYGCWSQPVDRQLVLDRDDICGDVFFVTNRCACGRDQHTSRDYSCSFDQAYWDEETGGEYAQCPDCGLLRRFYTETVYDPAACTASDLTHYTFFMNGAECASYTVESVREYHHTAATFDMQGDSCEDGYYVTYLCRYCDYSRAEEDLRYTHDTFETTVYDVSGLACCDGAELAAYACPCGQRLSYRNYFSCNFQRTEETDADGHNLYRCDTCGLQYSEYQTDFVTDTANCAYSFNQNYSFYRDGELLQTVVLPYRSASHNYVMTGAELNDPELGCEGGYVLTLQCPVCMDAYTTTYEGGDEHFVFAIDLFYVELEGGCRTMYEINGCACGKVRNCGCQYDSCTYEDSSETVVIGGISHNITTRTCTVCGFVITEDFYDQPTEDPCKIITNLEITYRYGDRVMTYVGSGENPNHELQPIGAALMEGNTNCDQGIIVTYGCTRCGYTDSREEWGHFTYTDETVDLEPYGSVHGGELAHFLCACGEISRYDFRNMTCDLDRQEIENFVDGAINEVWTNNAEGSTWIDSEAYLIKCAVTDPQCGLTIRMSEYWLADAATCTATEYQIWELGYDETTGTCQKSIVIPTGESTAYHSYVTTTIDEIDADGNHTTGYRDDCSVCGSYYSNYSVVYTDNTRKEYTDAVNMLDDGKTREAHHHYFSILSPTGTHWAQTEQRNEWVYADGTTYWDMYCYTYDPDNFCYRTRTFTYSDSSESYTTSEWSHYSEHVTGDDPTCTQYGHYCYMCVLCGELDGDIYETQPYGHDWYYDDSLGCYRCYRCGLENSNGADGSIVMEDMSDEERYIVGYWNKESISFEPKAAVVKYNAESGEEEVILLEDINIGYLTEGDDAVVAVAMDKVQVDEAVAAQLEGYEGSYAVRLILVPTDDQSIMDYALTFDTCYTEGWGEATEPAA